MPTPAFILFDDGLDLSPLTDLRASFELRTGAVRTLDRLTWQFPAPISAMLVPTCLAPLVSQRHTCPVNHLPDAISFRLINGRCTSLPPDLLDLPVSTALVSQTGDVVAAHLDHAAADAFAASGQLPAPTLLRPCDSLLLLRPWHLLDHVRANLPADLAAAPLPLVGSASPSIQFLGDHHARAAHSATLQPLLVFDTTLGDIVIDQHANIEPFTVLQGPCYIGPHVTIAAHAHIRPFTVIGEHCKVGGEVKATVFHSHSNKAHFGFLGDSIVGQWVNLGAGTTTSNLKNTYGQVLMQSAPDSLPQPTGLMGLGSILGDHVKTAIGTRLNTGSCLATGALFAGSSFAPKYLDRFAFATDTGITRYDFDKFRQVASRMMQRRNMSLSDADSHRLFQLHSTLPA